MLLLLLLLYIWWSWFSFFCLFVWFDSIRFVSFFPFDLIWLFWWSYTYTHTQLSAAFCCVACSFNQCWWWRSLFVLVIIQTIIMKIWIPQYSFSRFIHWYVLSVGVYLRNNKMVIHLTIDNFVYQPTHTYILVARI